MKIRSAVLSLAFVLAFVLAYTGRATATAVKLEIPKQGWAIAFDSPVLSQPQESKRGEGEYAFRASSGRFNISLFVENPGGPGKTHRDCYAFYWAQSSRNPRIAKDTVQSSETRGTYASSTTSSWSFRGSRFGTGMSTTTSYFNRSGSTCTSRSPRPPKPTRIFSRLSIEAYTTEPDPGPGLLQGLCGTAGYHGVTR